MPRPNLTSLLALLALGTMPATRAAAHTQNQRSAASHTLSGVLGIAVDSIHGGALVGATVRIEGLGRETTTDGKGHYRIDSVPPGQYRISLHHPLLDTLGMEIGTQPIDFPAGQIPVVPLGTPSAASMLKIACPAVIKQSEGPSGLLGVVRDPDTEKPAIGATVTLSWVEITANKVEGIRRVHRSHTATVDSSGNYAICGLPNDLNGSLQASLGNAATANVDVTIGANLLLGLRSLTLGAAEIVTDSINGAPRTRRRGPAGVRGRVVNPDGTAVPGADVEVLGSTAAVKSASNGAFNLTGAPAGTQALAVRSVGFSPSVTIVELSAKTPREVTVTLNSVQVLPTVQAQASLESGLDRVGFTGRKRNSFGRFITREEIERRNPIAISDILSTVPGVRATTDSQGNDALISSRESPGSPTSCTAVYVDHMKLRPPLEGQLVSHMNFMVRPEQVAAIEVYQPFDVPGEFTEGPDRCLTFVIWTRFGVGDQQNRPSP